MNKKGENNIRTNDIMFEIAEAYKNETRETFLNELHEANIDTIPGVKYSYSNNGANLAGHILETVYKKDYSTLLREHIFSKANMNSSYSLHSDKKTVANGYSNNGELLPFLSLDNGYGAEGSIKSTTPDIIKYIQFNLNNDKYIKESFSKQYKSKENWLGYFWKIEKNEKSLEYLRHNGGAFGSQNTIYIIPKHNTGIHIITNVAGGKTSKTIRNATEKLIDNLTENKI